MRRDCEHGNAAPDLTEREAEAGGAPIFGQWPELCQRGCTSGGDEYRDRQHQSQGRDRTPS